MPVRPRSLQPYSSADTAVIDYEIPVALSGADAATAALVLSTLSCITLLLPPLPHEAERRH